jgi:dehydrogenase/reductase SDR family protein 1
MSQRRVGKPNALASKIAIVTGASRGLGKGIAIELGAAGATVYVTARGITSNTSQLGTIEETANDVTQAGGRGIAPVSRSTACSAL